MRNGALLFYSSNQEGTIQPSETSFQYRCQGAKWLPVRTGLSWGQTTLDPVGAPDSLTYSEYYAISKPKTSAYNNEPTPGSPAIIWSGRHAPDVTEIWLVQGASTQKNPADGHSGVWTICTEKIEPFRVEAHDFAGPLVGYLDEPLSKWK
jgi:hypothetical protein